MKAQVSLEFLLLLLAFLAVFAALLPVYAQAYNAGIFAVEAGKAEAFSAAIKETASEFSFLGEGSSRIIEASAFLPWEIESRENTLFVTVKSPFLEKQKTFEIIFPGNFSYAKFGFSGKKKFLIEKIPGNISFKNLD